MKRTLQSVSVIILMFLLSACVTSPTGRSQMILVSDAQMDQMGEASFTDLKSKNPPSADSRVNEYVRCLSTPLLVAAGENPAQWEVQVFNDASPNAFALPGKKIGVHTGMIELAKTPDQLAAVVGHEIGHVQAHHGAERVSMNMASETAQQLTSVALDGTEYSNYALAAVGMGAQYGLLLPYSRTHESEADYIGLMIMAEAGFDPAQAVALWQEMAKAAGDSPPEFMSTHPSHSTRIKKLTGKQGEAGIAYQQAVAAGKTPNCVKP